MQSIFEIFEELKDQTQVSSDSYVIASLPAIKNHKIGISQSQQPLFFIKCADTSKLKSLDVSLAYISVLYDRPCQLIHKDGKAEDGMYAVISLKTDSEYLQEYFLSIVYLLIEKLPEEPLLASLKLEVDKLVSLFSKFTKPAAKTILGLWAELLTIEQAKNADYLIQSWHSSTSDKFDFNDGKDKIEVKSTTRSRRIHSFASEQLAPNPNAALLIVSILTVETGVGKNVFDLVGRIEGKLSERSLVFRLNEIVAETLGQDIEKAVDVFFDYQLALDSMRFYNGIDIPTISAGNIPANIMNVRFECDLTDIQEIGESSSQSFLHNALI